MISLNSGGTGNESLGGKKMYGKAKKPKVKKVAKVAKKKKKK